MDYNINEVSKVEQAAVEATDAQMMQLNELQLALIGGGVGETIAV